LHSNKSSKGPKNTLLTLQKIFQKRQKKLLTLHSSRIRRQWQSILLLLLSLRLIQSATRFIIPNSQNLTKLQFADPCLKTISKHSSSRGSTVVVALYNSSWRLLVCNDSSSSTEASSPPRSMLCSCHELGAQIGSLDRGRKPLRNGNIWCQERASQLLLESEKHEVHGRRHSSSFAHESCRVNTKSVVWSHRNGRHPKEPAVITLLTVCPYVYRLVAVLRKTRAPGV